MKLSFTPIKISEIGRVCRSNLFVNFLAFNQCLTKKVIIRTFSLSNSNKFAKVGFMPYSIEIIDLFLKRSCVGGVGF